MPNDARPEPGGHIDAGELVDYFAKQLSLDRELELDAHFAVCAHCVEEARGIRELVMGLSQSGIAALRDAYRHRPPERALQQLVWLSVFAGVAFAAARRKRQQFRTPGESVTETKWSEGALVCRVRESSEGTVFGLESSDPAWGQRLVRFQVLRAESGDRWTAGLLVPHAVPEASTVGGTARITAEGRLPANAELRVELCDLSNQGPVDIPVLRAALDAAFDDRDRDAWLHWIESQVTAGRLSAADRRALQAPPR
jgi:hypothetical protein